MKRATLVAIAVTSGTLAAAAPAGAFHHVVLPAFTCGEGAWAGGSNPTARGAIVAHNPAQGGALPLPPAGTPSQAVNAPAAERCAGT